MKALTVHQPFAEYIVGGVKTIEVRSYPTSHRGPLLICASAAQRKFFIDFKECGDGRGLTQLPAGCQYGIVNVIDCRPMKKSDEDDAGCALVKGAWAWVLEPVCEVKPVKITGKQGLFEVEDSRIIRLGDDESILDFPLPQGAVKHTKLCPTVQW